MNADPPVFRIATFRARRGCAERLAQRSLDAARVALVADRPAR